MVRGFFFKFNVTCFLTCWAAIFQQFTSFFLVSLVSAFGFRLPATTVRDLRCVVDCGSVLIKKGITQETKREKQNCHYLNSDITVHFIILLRCILWVTFERLSSMKWNLCLLDVQVLITRYYILIMATMRKLILNVTTIIELWISKF